MSQENLLTTEDRFAIFEQLNLHQRCIDNDATRASVAKYIDLYWPEGKFVVHDLRDNVFEGSDGLKQMYDYAHSVFPMQKWWHTLGAFEIHGAGSNATVEWRWIVSWKAEHEGVVSTGTYSDKFERRDGVWKCIERVSNTDPNWPASLFQPFIDAADKTFKAS